MQSVLASLAVSSRSLGIVVILVLVCAAFLALAAHYSKARTMLERWAARNGFRILRMERRDFRRGPFFWSTARGQVVYHIVVVDRHGRRRSGYVRCGGWFWGVWSEHVDVRWE